MSPALGESSPKELNHIEERSISPPTYLSKESTVAQDLTIRTPRMRPVLKGVLKKVRDGEEETVIWEGRWSMKEEDVENDRLIDSLDKFYYKRVKLVEVRDGNDTDRAGYFSGHFFISRASRGGASPKPSTKHIEKDILLKFVPRSDTANTTTHLVHGTGQNKFGKFTLDGSFHKPTGVLFVRRNYLPRKCSRNRKASMIRVARELELSRQQSESDLRNLDSELEDSIPFATGKDEIKSVLLELISKDAHKWFCNPVDAKALGLHDYHEIIHSPMDLGTVLERIEVGKYKTVQHAYDDICLTFQNAIHYNPRGHPVYRKATDLLQYFMEVYETKFGSTIQRTKSLDKLTDSIAMPAVISRIGKRIRMPKTGLISDDIPQLKRKRSSTSISSNEHADTNDRKSSRDEKPLRSDKYGRSKSPRTKSREESSEIKKLRKQVRKLSNHLTKIGSAMLNESLSKTLVAQQKKQNVNVKRNKTEREFTFDEKQQLGSDIHRLPGEKIAKVIDIVQSNGDNLIQSEDGEVELDIGSLKNSTLRKLKAYVQRNKSKRLATN